MNETDKRIIKLFLQGVTPQRIAKRIGRPDDVERVMDAIRRWTSRERKANAVLCAISEEKP